MSLKDRLNTQQQKQNQPMQQEVKPNYYNSDIEANIDNLGALETLFADDDLNNIFVSGAKNIYIEKSGKITKSTSTFRDNVQLENMLKKIALSQGYELDEFNPYFKFNHKQGINVTTTVPPLSNVPVVFIKCYKDKHANLKTLQEDFIISKEIALILEALCTIRKNILITGKKNTLKTTLLSALAKKITTNNKAVIIDSENEFKIIGQNYTNYDFSKITNELQNDLLESIININPDKLIINSQNETLVSDFIQKAQCGYRGAIIGVCANNIEEAIEKITHIYLKNNPFISYQKAKMAVINVFDIAISAKKDDIGRRKIDRISQINILKDDLIEDIFALDFSQHKSCGVIPDFYEDIKNNSLPIGDNIFDINYKHTYHKGANLESDAQSDKKNINVDILKKFKKELPTRQNEEEEQKEVEKIFKEPSPEEIIKKAQEKFEELKKNAQIQDEFEIKIEDIQENSTDESQNENL